MIRAIKTGVHWLIFTLLAICLGLGLLLVCNGSITLRKQWFGPFWKSISWKECTLEFSAVTLSLDGGLQMENATLKLAGETDPVCVFPSAQATVSLQRWWNDEPWLCDLSFRQGKIFVSRRYSPTGKEYPVIQQLSVDLVPDLDSHYQQCFIKLEGIVEDTRVQLIGTIPLQLEKTSTGPRSISEQFHRYSREWREIWPWLHGVSGGAIDGALQPDSQGQLILTSATVRVDKASHPQWGEIRNIHASVQDLPLLDLQAPQSASIRIKDYQGNLPKIEGPAQFSGLTLDMRRSSKDEALIIHGMIHDLQWQDYHLDSFYSRNRWYPESDQIHSFVLMKRDEQELQIDYDGELLTDFKGVIHGYGTLDPMVWVETSGLWEGQFRWKLPPQKVLSQFVVRVGGENTVEEAWFDLQAKDFGWENLPQFHSLKAQGGWKNNRLRLKSFVVHGEGFELSGNASANLHSKRFRVYTHGYLNPLPWSPELPKWWRLLWDDFQFLQQPPSLEVRASGSWARAHDFRVEADVEATHLLFHEVATNRLATSILVKPGFLWLQDIQIETAGGMGRGNLWRNEAVPFDGISHYFFDIQSRIPPHQLARMVDDSVEDILKDFSFSGSTYIHGQGSFFTGKQPFLNYADFSLLTVTESPVQIAQFPLDWLSARSFYKAGNVSLKNVNASMTEGLLHGEAEWQFSHQPPVFEFSAQLDHANLIPFISLWKKSDQVLVHTSEEEPVTIEQSGILDLQIHLKGPWKQWDQLTGDGNFTVKEGNFQKINLLGILSSILPITSIELKEAKGSIAWNHDILQFPDLNISGPTTSLQANGNYSLSRNEIDFMVKVFYLKEAPILRILSPIFHPFAHLLELRMWGAFDKPQWRFNIDPRNLFSSP